MPPIQRIALIGLGALGSAYASRLYDWKADALTIVADPRRSQRYREVWINDKPYAFRFAAPDESAAPADLVLIAVKHHHLPQALEDIRHHVGEHTIILSLLNGITSEEMVAARYGWERVLYSYAVGIDALREENRFYFTHIGKVVFGEARNLVESERVARVRALFEQADIPYQVPADMIQSMWWKFMINVGVNQTSAVLRAPYGVFQTVPEVRKLMEAAMGEVVALAQAMKIGLTEADIERFRDILFSLNPQGKTSMLQDIEAGRKTEVEILAGQVLRLGQRLGVPTPINRTLYDLICAIEAINGAR